MLYENIRNVPINLSGSVAIKLHMGEKGGKPPIPVEDVRVIFEILESSGCRPFLIDTTVLYKSIRNTREGYLGIAKDNGYGEFPIVIADDHLFVEKNGIRISKQITDADSILVLSHATGHILTGFGGAVKNLGMGCLTKDGKRKVHQWTQPRHDDAKCASCGACIEACPRQLISFGEDGKLKIDYTHCGGCRRCVLACPTGANWHPEDGVKRSFETFAVAAKSVISFFQKNRVMYLTSLNGVTPLCDCSGTPGEIACKDIGYLVEDDPLKIDQKAVELITKENPEAINMKTWNLFVEQAKKHF
ncbi:MAG: DUF362 domain-containing protein [Candidatus Aenigmarchaeota archaeon]|nr:DUF362 domain-containing protein [Candidatus Aenigmarchaeota archaeon]